MLSCRYQRRERPDSTLLVVGIPNVGKSSLINRLRSDHLQVPHIQLLGFIS